MSEKNSFEKSMKKLEEYSKKISSPDISLEEAIKSYESGILEYNKCKSILEESKQRIDYIGEGNE